MDWIHYILAGTDPATFAIALGVTFVGGFVKGALGFAMPMVLMSILPGFMPVELALAGLLLPTLFTNLSQALRQGWQAAWGSVQSYWRMLLALVGFLIVSAQGLALLSPRLLLALLGGPIVAFALLQLFQIPLRVPVQHRNRAEWVSGAVGGLYGGVSGIWGPPVMVYLLSVDVAKQDLVRVLGVVFLIGCFAMLVGHGASGLLNAQRLAFSAALVVPGMIGLWLGYIIQDRLDAARFRRWTLVLLVLTGLNLLRQAAMG
jgi:uncharacterized membrane protein YfcA